VKISYTAPIWRRRHHAAGRPPSRGSGCRNGAPRPGRVPVCRFRNCRNCYGRPNLGRDSGSSFRLLVRVRDFRSDILAVHFAAVSVRRVRRPRILLQRVRVLGANRAGRPDPSDRAPTRATSPPSSSACCAPSSALLPRRLTPSVTLVRGDAGAAGLRDRLVTIRGGRAWSADGTRGRAGRFKAPRARWRPRAPFGPVWERGRCTLRGAIRIHCRRPRFLC